MYPKIILVFKDCGRFGKVRGIKSKKYDDKIRIMVDDQAGARSSNRSYSAGFFKKWRIGTQLYNKLSIGDHIDLFRCKWKNKAKNDQIQRGRITDIVLLILECDLIFLNS